jgi:DNA-directed RNA polymerase specialized sigma24 family protein
MFKRLNSWRLKRRQHALALAWCGDPAAAAWLVQETHKDAAAFNRVAVYRRMAQYWLDHQQQQPARPADDSPPASSDNTNASQHPLNSQVRELIAHMPLVQRMTLSLIDVAGLSYRETAAVMDMGLFDVQYHVVTARRQLLDGLRSDEQMRVCVDADTSKPVSSC